MSDTLQTFTYKHDNGPSDAELQVERLGFDGKFYRVEIRVTDPTDYERILAQIPWMYRGNPTFINPSMWFS